MKSTVNDLDTLLHGLHIVSSCTPIIYSINTILYPYTLPLIHIPYSSSSLCLSCNLNSSLRLLQAERNYEIYDKELLAIVEALSKWRQYLLDTLETFEI